MQRAVRHASPQRVVGEGPGGDVRGKRRQGAGMPSEEEGGKPTGVRARVRVRV